MWCRLIVQNALFTLWLGLGTTKDDLVINRLWYYLLIVKIYAVILRSHTTFNTREKTISEKTILPTIHITLDSLDGVLITETIIWDIYIFWKIQSTQGKNYRYSSVYHCKYTHFSTILCLYYIYFNCMVWLLAQNSSLIPLYAINKGPPVVNVAKPSYDLRTFFVPYHIEKCIVELLNIPDTPYTWILYRNIYV